MEAVVAMQPVVRVCDAGDDAAAWDDSVVLATMSKSWRRRFDVPAGNMGQALW